MSSQDIQPKPDGYKENPVYRLETDFPFLMVKETHLLVVVVFYGNLFDISFALRYYYFLEEEKIYPAWTGVLNKLKLKRQIPVEV